ncbi:methyltransferase domain-containing protein (plasmid) [Deinococcus psychrotolerans]|uniref:Methyltransferase domain-containing protein n=1 Tax=Deinococcus psychrotolerans TaxID=2489213 RepID=A0A3G8YPV2_9DEIO|nr:class I SAM-dependent methyltransferase [Deinococcus psychrotolerans]AZI44634.1 methyltransferase domain-containing protein [Deinococcus psychrotolerans]
MTLGPSPLFPDLRRRLTGVPEAMDADDCDLTQLEQTYRNFGQVNAVVSGWRAVYQRELRPLLSATRPSSLLDIGCGGGDVPRQLGRWAAQDGLRLDITAIDADERAIRYASALPQLVGASPIRFRQAMSHDLVREGRLFDFVISNHLLHHLRAEELAALLDDCQRLCLGKVIHSDLERHPLPYAVFSTLTLPLFKDSFIRADGLLSIRRSFTPSELRRMLPSGWRLRRQFPFRHLLLYQYTRHA